MVATKTKPKKLPRPLKYDPIDESVPGGRRDDRAKIESQIWAEQTLAANVMMASGLKTFTESRMRQNPGSAQKIMEAHNRLAESYGYGWNKIDPKWAALCGAGSRYGTGSKAERLEWERETSRYLYDQTTHACGIIETIITYSCGQELNISFTEETNEKSKDGKKTKETALVKKFKDKWFEIYRRHNTQFEVRASEMVRRALRDGESINHVFLKEIKGASPNLTEVEGLEELVTLPAKFEAVWRFGEPEDLKTPIDKKDVSNIDYGVQFDPKDPEEIILYHFTPPNDAKSFTIPADEIRHVKIGTSLNSHRGLPLLRGQVAERCKQYGDWLDTRIFLNKARASIAAVVYRDQAVNTDKSAWQKTQTGIENRRLPNGSVQQIQKYIWDVATVLTMRKEDKLEFLSPNLGADQAKDDGRAILCSIAVAIGLSDYLITGDSNQGKYANQEVAESRGIATLTGFQRFFLRHVAWIVKRMVVLELVQEDPTILSKSEKIEAVVLGPKIIPRDVLAWARANDLRLKNRTISRPEVMRGDGLDSDRIMEEIETDYAWDEKHPSEEAKLASAKNDVVSRNQQGSKGTKNPSKRTTARGAKPAKAK